MNGRLVRSDDESPYTWGDDAELDSVLSNMRSGDNELKAVAFDNAGNTGESVINVKSKTGILSIVASFSNSAVYPNPFFDHLILRISEQVKSVSLVNALGAELLVNWKLTPDGNVKISPVNQVPAGVYYLGVNVGESMKVIRVVSQ